MTTTLLGGSIAVSSTEGQGTRFTLTLPTQAPEPSPDHPLRTTP